MERAGKNDWLVSQSLERSLDIISAINALSIHHKLKTVGAQGVVSPENTEAARAAVKQFLLTLAGLIEQAGKAQDHIAFGADPRLGSLARRFLGGGEPGSAAGGDRLAELKELTTLLAEGDSANDELLLAELARVRSVLEQHSQADAAIVFNEV